LDFHWKTIDCSHTRQNTTQAAGGQSEQTDLLTPSFPQVRSAKASRFDSVTSTLPIPFSLSLPPLGCARSCGQQDDVGYCTNPPCCYVVARLTGAILTCPQVIPHRNIPSPAHHIICKVGSAGRMGRARGGTAVRLRSATRCDADLDGPPPSERQSRLSGPGINFDGRLCRCAYIPICRSSNRKSAYMSHAQSIHGAMPQATATPRKRTTVAFYNALLLKSHTLVSFYALPSVYGWAETLGA
jgi:hypothetical protein